MANEVKVIELYETFIPERQAGEFVDKVTGSVTPYSFREAYKAKVILVETNDLLRTRINFKIPKSYPTDINVGDLLMIESYQLTQLNKQFDLKNILRHQSVSNK